jgi:hypothetical protein
MKVREVLDGELENNRHVIEYGIQPLIK